MTVEFALNHMTVARQSFAQLLDTAVMAGCTGIELRNDLPQPLFDGLAPATAGAMVRDKGLRVLALAEVKRFNDWTPDKAGEALALIRIARDLGAEAVALIPRNDNGGMNNGERQANLRLALRELAPMLGDHGLTGLVEPLGFETCALRHKAEAVEAIDALGAGAVFKLVHDTFHHHLAQDDTLFAAHTGIVHVSGVVDQTLALRDMADGHRILVDGDDRLGNIAQIRALVEAGYTGPVSFEAFADQVHTAADPVGELRRSIEYVRAGLTARAA